MMVILTIVNVVLLVLGNVFWYKTGVVRNEINEMLRKR